MATHEVDQKLLAKLAHENASSQPSLAKTLLQILGLSIMLGPRLVSARKARIFLATNDHDAVLLIHQIIWLSRTGLQLLEDFVMPVAADTADSRLKVFAAKLRASFYHVFCLFRNNPAILLKAPIPVDSASQHRRQGSSSYARKGQKTSPNAQAGQTGDTDNSPPSASARRQKTGLRDPIQSMNSEVSYITNPYPNEGGNSRSPAVGPPPGIPARRPISVPDNSTFILPVRDYTPMTTKAFSSASRLASDLLPGSAPLRLSVLLEHCAYLWDCLADHKGSRDLARKTIRDVYRTSDPISDDDFEDARVLVATLGRMMRRKSAQTTPRFGGETPPPPRPPSQMYERTSQERPPPPPTFAVNAPHPLSQVTNRPERLSRPLTTFEEDVPQSTRSSGVGDVFSGRRGEIHHEATQPMAPSQPTYQHTQHSTTHPTQPLQPASATATTIVQPTTFSPPVVPPPPHSPPPVPIDPGPSASVPARSPSRRSGHISDSSITTTPDSLKGKRSSSGPAPVLPPTPPETGPTPSLSGSGKRAGSPRDSPTPRARPRR